MIALVVIYTAYDYDNVLSIFERFVEWVAEKPMTSSLAIVILYVGLVVFTFPIMYLSVALGYAYSKAYLVKSSIDGEHTTVTSVLAFITAWALISSAVTLGAVLAFLISRYWLGKTIKKSCLRNH